MVLDVSSAQGDITPTPTAKFVHVIVGEHWTITALQLDTASVTPIMLDPPATSVPLATMGSLLVHLAIAPEKDPPTAFVTHRVDSAGVALESPD